MRGCRQNRAGRFAHPSIFIPCTVIPEGSKLHPENSNIPCTVIICARRLPGSGRGREGRLSWADRSHPHDTMGIDSIAEYSTLRARFRFNKYPVEIDTPQHIEISPRGKLFPFPWAKTQEIPTLVLLIFSHQDKLLCCWLIDYVKTSVVCTSICPPSLFSITVVDPSPGKQLLPTRERWARTWAWAH